MPAILDQTGESALIGLVEVRRYRAIALRELNRPAESDAAIRSAIAMAEANALQQPAITARLHRTGGLSDGRDGTSDAALSELRRASADFSSVLPGARPVAVTDLLRAGELMAEKHSDLALGLCRQAVGMLRDLKTGIGADLLAPCLDAYADVAHNDQALLAEMFEASQLVQGSVTSQEIGLASARLEAGAKDPRVGDAIRRRQDAEAKLAGLYRARDALSTDGESNPTNREALKHGIPEAQAALADADAALQAAAPNYGQLVQQIVPASAVFTALRPDEAFASITLTPRNAWTFVLRNGMVHVARADKGRDDITALVKRIRQGVEPGSAGLPHFDTNAAAELYAVTLGGAQAGLEGAHGLVVAPSGPLLSVPFGALLTAPADGHDLASAPWLIRRFAVSHVPAAANFVSLRKTVGGSHAARPWYGFGDFKPVTMEQAEHAFPSGSCADSARLLAHVPPLPFARRELEAARLLMGAAASDESLGASFTAAHVQQVKLADYRVIHFAAHALLPSEIKCQSEPAIITSAPAGAPSATAALLTASDVVNLNLDANLVILSACNSGGPGQENGGESLSGLARAFFYAGARAMMVTHWSVNDQTTAFLVASSLKQIRAGQGAAEALRSAQLDLLEAAGKAMPADLGHPFYWAAFALVGEGRAQ
jgi:CHAT domain-containing protein